MSHHESWPGEPSDVADLEDELDEPGDDEDDDEDTGDEPAPDDDEPDDDEPDDDEAYDDGEPSLRLAGHAGGELDVPDDVDLLEGEPRSTRRGVGVVVARDQVMVMAVPGAFELPLGAMALAKTRRYACIVPLGCVIRGETAR